MKKLFIVLCIGAFLAVLAIHLQAQTGPGTGPWGGGPDFFSDAMSSMDRAFNQNDSEPTPEDAYFLGRAVAAHILTTYRPFAGNPALTRYLNRICQAIVVNSSRPDLFSGYFVTILDTMEFNAFASPGGHIFLTRGLVNAATSEDMLASVIAHEIAHINLGHGMQIIRDMRISSEAEEMAGRAAALTGNTQAAQRLLAIRNSTDQILDTLMRSGFSQPQEFAADREAVTLLVAAGYDPGALVEVLRILQRVQSSQRGGFNITHPTPAQRITNIEPVVRQQRVQNTSSHRASRFQSNR